MITSFPKIFAIGTDYIIDIFNEVVEITEKIDGSQFVFGKINNELYLRSKGAMLYKDNPEKMFSAAISHITSIQDKLPEGKIFYCEYLQKPKQNTLKYNRIPNNHLILFGVKDISEKLYPIQEVKEFADIFEIETVPIIYYGKINNVIELTGLLDRESILGGCKIEGIVVKNYHRKFLLGGQPMPLMAGKFVSEGFKEVHRERWGAEEKSKSSIEVFFDSFRTPARWDKTIQHIREKGELENTPKDIGKLFKEIHIDIETEEKENIKNWLWNEFKGELFRKATKGMPEYYKNKLLERNFMEGF